MISYHVTNATVCLLCGACAQCVPYPAYSCTVAVLQTTPLSLHRFCADCPPTHSPHHMCKSPRSQSSGQRAVSVHWRGCLDHRRSQLQEGWGKMSGGQKRIHYIHMDITSWDILTVIETMEHEMNKTHFPRTFHNSVMECQNTVSRVRTALTHANWKCSRPTSI